MKKIKYSLALLITSLFLIYSCDDPALGPINPFEGTDYGMLVKTDDENIIKYLSTHYYDETSKSIKLIENGEVAMINSDDLKTQTVTTSIDGREYDLKLYTYITKIGDGNPDSEYAEVNEGKPTNIDSVLVNYSGRVLIPETTLEIDGVETTVGNDLSGATFDSGDLVWQPSGNSTTILGWGYGFTQFKPGTINTDKEGDRIKFDGAGEGFIFIPSGLAYPSTLYDPRNSNPPPYDLILVFEVDLLDFVPNTDHDNDGIPSILESPDCDKNPRNDFNDKFFPTTPDYLNANIAIGYDCNK